ncbi:ABC transporter permease [Edaphobacter dinghuensis]|uniref:ABC transporter permease n=1 Tax=Edaphobacter dinghuensis TaxID=1560005 RepID=A0A917HMB2_9BACT|nr:ABC transporter permease [Edaphobacter dinghuensis]GGG84031.1 ABC transporter permease [Edaphobacter dinghuensis]
MPIREIFRQTLSALWESKLRSFLTMFGIVWGITSVILLVGLGIGFNLDQKQHLRTIGTDIAIIFGGKTGMQAGGYAAGRDIILTIDDAIAIQQQAYLVKTVSPEIRRSVSEVSPWNAASRPIRGVWPQYQRFRSLTVDQGRLISDEDEANARRVILLGAEANRQLFPGKPVIGQKMLVAGYEYTVIGVLANKKQNGSYGSGPDNTQLFAPYSAMARDFPPTDPGMERGYVNNIVVEPVSPDLHVKALDQVKRIIAERHHYDPDDKEALWIWDTLDGSKFTERIFSVMTFFFGAVALLTLALGGIGVMNIMLVAVTERTREIGVRKALGATALDIRRQFLVESAIITIVSGATGLTVGVGICLLLRLVPLPDFVPHPVISPVAIIASLATLTVITLFAGTYPALRAANLSPMECLRTE